MEKTDDDDDGEEEEEEEDGTRGNAHAFTWTSVRQPSKCPVCKKYMLGFNKQKFLRCSDCGMSVHENCVDQAQASASCRPRPAGPSARHAQAASSTRSAPPVSRPQPPTPAPPPKPATSSSAATSEDEPPMDASGTSTPPILSDLLAAITPAASNSDQEDRGSDNTKQRGDTAVVEDSSGDAAKTAPLRKTSIPDAESSSAAASGSESPMDATGSSTPPVISDLLAAITPAASNSDQEDRGSDNIKPRGDTAVVEDSSGDGAETAPRKISIPDPEEPVDGDQQALASESEDTEVDSDDSGANLAPSSAATLSRTHIGRLEVEILDSRQISREGSRHILSGELTKALGYSVAHGGTIYRSPRLEAIARERAALRKGDHLKRLTNIPAAQQRVSETPVWALGKTYAFDVFDLAGDLEVVLYKSAATMSIMNRSVLGQINIPVLDLLEGCEGWFEIFPRSKRFKKRRVRPAVPVIDKSGLEFPRTSLGYLKLRVSMQLFVDTGALWKLYVAQLHPLELKDSFRTTYRSVKIKDSLDAFTEIRRNAVRINIVRAYLYNHLVHGPCAVLDEVRSWRNPALSLASWALAFLFIFVVPVWLLPVAAAGIVILMSRLYLEGDHLRMNWESVPRPADKQRASRGRSERSRTSKWRSSSASATALASSPTSSSRRQNNTVKALWAAKSRMENVFFSKRADKGRPRDASLTDDEEDEAEDESVPGDDKVDEEEVTDDYEAECGIKARTKTEIAPSDHDPGVRDKSEAAAQAQEGDDGVEPQGGEDDGPQDADEGTDVDEEEEELAMQTLRASVASASSASSAVATFPSGHAFDRPEDKVFTREPRAERFFIWNHQINDPKRGLNLIERSTLVWRELRWVQELTCDIAEAGEKMALTLSRANPHASGAVDVLLVAVSTAVSIVLYLWSTFPLLAQSALFGALVVSTLPPALRASLFPARAESSGGKNDDGDADVTATESLVLRSWDRLAALWARLATIDDLGHRFVASMQRVRYEPEFEAELSPRPQPRSSSGFNAENISRMLLKRRTATTTSSLAKGKSRASSSSSSADSGPHADSVSSAPAGLGISS